MTAVSKSVPRESENWPIVIFAMLGVAVCCTPVAILSLSVFFIPLGEALGWGRGQVAAALSILALAMGVTTPFVGRIIDRFGVKPVLITSLVLYAVVMAATPLFVSLAGLWGFYIAYALIGVVGAGSNTVAYTHLISGWFDKARGLALGFTVSGIAVGAVITPPIAAYLIESFSWQVGFYGLALLPTIIGLPIALFALREAPKLVAAHDDPAVEAPGIDAKTAFKTGTFWTLFPVFLIVATCLHGVQLHLPSLLADRGLPTQTAVGVFSLLFIVTAISRIAIGFLIDRLFAPKVGFVLFIAGAAGVAMVLPEWALPYYLIAAILMGVATGAETDLLAYLSSRYYGMRAFGQIYGGLFLAFMIGSAIGPYVLGFGYDTWGNYDATLTMCVAGMIISSILLLTLPRFPKLAETPIPAVSPQPLIHEKNEKAS